VGAATTDFNPTLETLIVERGTKEALAWTEGDALMREIIFGYWLLMEVSRQWKVNKAINLIQEQGLQ
jgi:hypothetical protein